MQLVRLAAHGQKLRARRRPIRRLGESPLAERQGLVAADHDAAVRTSPRRCGLSRAPASARPRPDRRSRLARSRARRDAPAAPRPEYRRLPAARGAPCFATRAPAACRSEPETIIGARSTMPAAGAGPRAAPCTAAAVSSIERRVTSMIGQLCLAHSLRENAISSATAWRST